MTKIQVEVEIENKTMDEVWDASVNPEKIEKWNFAADTWECVNVKNDLRVGGKISSRMQAKDKSMGFDFVGTYTNIVKNELIEFDLDDNRHVEIKFVEDGDKIRVVQIFDAEESNSIDIQREGWQAILNNFKKYVENS